MPIGIYKRTSEMKTGKHMLGRKLPKKWRENIGKGSKGRIISKKNREITIARNRLNIEERHPRWKGESCGQTALHNWVAKHRGKPKYCEHCGRKQPPKGKGLSRSYFQWANISKEYKRELSDWVRLCYLCHKLFDKK